MKLFTKKRYLSWNKTYFFLGKPFLVKQKTAARVDFSLFGFRIYQKNRGNTSACSSASVSLSQKQLARIRYSLRANENRKIDKNFKEDEKNKKITLLVPLSSLLSTSQRGICRFGLNLLKAMEATGKIRIDFLKDKDYKFDGEEFYKNHNITSLDQLSDCSVYDFYFEPELRSRLYMSVIANNIQRASCARYRVGLVHDLIPVIYSWEYAKGFARTEVALHNIVLADHIFTISKCTANDVMNILDIPHDKITVIYGASGSDIFSKDACEYDYEKRNNDLVTLLGGNFRKNVKGTIEAFSKAYLSGKLPKDARLVFGTTFADDKKNDYDEFIKEVPTKFPGIEIGKQIILQPDGYRPTDKEIADWLQSCRATIFASFYEGLGMPILESYAANTPCIASNNSSVAEITATECQCNPFDIDDIAAKIIEIYNSPELCKKSLDFGKKLLAEKCNWEIVAAKVIARLEEMMKPKEIL